MTATPSTLAPPLARLKSAAERLRAKSKDASGHEHDALGRFGSGGAGVGGKKPKHSEETAAALRGHGFSDKVIARMSPRDARDNLLARGHVFSAQPPAVTNGPHHLPPSDEHAALRLTLPPRSPHLTPELKKDISDVVQKYLKPVSDSELGLTEVGHVRDAIRSAIGPGAGNHDVLDHALLDLWREGKVQLHTQSFGLKNHPHPEKMLHANDGEDEIRGHNTYAWVSRRGDWVTPKAKALTPPRAKSKDTTAKGLRAGVARLKSAAARLKARNKPPPRLSPPKE